MLTLKSILGWRKLLLIPVIIKIQSTPFWIESYPVIRAGMFQKVQKGRIEALPLVAVGSNGGF